MIKEGRQISSLVRETIFWCQIHLGISPKYFSSFLSKNNRTSRTSALISSGRIELKYLQTVQKIKEDALKIENLQELKILKTKIPLDLKNSKLELIFLEQIKQGKEESGGI